MRFRFLGADRTDIRSQLHQTTTQAPTVVVTLFVLEDEGIVIQVETAEGRVVIQVGIAEGRVVIQVRIAEGSVVIQVGIAGWSVVI